MPPTKTRPSCRCVLIPAVACRRHRFTLNIPRPERSAHLNRHGWMKSLFSERSHPASAIDADEMSSRTFWCFVEDPTLVNSSRFVLKRIDSSLVDGPRASVIPTPQVLFAVRFWSLHWRGTLMISFAELQEPQTICSMLLRATRTFSRRLQE